MTIPQGEKAERKENRRCGGGRQADTVVGDSSKTIKEISLLREMKSSNTVFRRSYFLMWRKVLNSPRKMEEFRESMSCVFIIAL